jgi:pimeloyl-ACP methyl ester carboxylesterase
VLRPFERVPFHELPTRPRLPHAYGETAARELTMKSRPFGELTIHYREHGEGEPLLLVHGLMTTSYSWRYVYSALGARYRVIAPDLPGAGRSDKPDVPYHASALAEWIGEFQRELGITGCKAVGNSLGGYLCMRHALVNRKAFARLVNMHSPAAPDPRYFALHAALSIPGVKRGLARFIRRDPLRWIWRNVHYYDETLKSREELAEYAAAIASPAGARAFVRYLHETMAPSGFAEFFQEVPRFDVPLLLLYSRIDPLVPPKNGERLHGKIPGSRLVWLETTSHFAHVDTPEPVVRELFRFLND